MTTPRLPPELLRATESPRDCSYLDSETASLEYRLFSSLSPQQVEVLLQRGWRRFGMHFFRPVCPNCSQCVPIRIVVDKFQPSKSQRRLLRKNQHITMEVARPTVSQEHLDLFHRWHADMTLRRGWEMQSSSAHDYASGFLSGDFGSLRELRYFDQDRLVGVGLVDVLPESLSSAYFYHDPDWRDLGPGTYSLMCEIELAQQLGVKHLYLGYWIAQCPSMAYKNRFEPSEILSRFVDDEEEPEWKPLCS